MQKKTRALSGASQDAYFRRVFKAYPNLSADERERLVRRLRQEIAQLRLRRSARDEAGTVESAAPAETKPAPALAVPAASAPTRAASPPFDPFSPNVIVVVRTSGRDAAMAALTAIDSLDNLRLLAREQRLAVAGAPSSASDLRTAIVAAAERRIANRMAAAS
jgi:hypothetical protein